MSITLVTSADELLAMPNLALLQQKKQKKKPKHDEFSCLLAGCRRMVHATDNGALLSGEGAVTMGNMYVAITKTLEARARIALEATPRETMYVGDIKEAARYVLPADVYASGLLILKEAIGKREALEAKWAADPSRKRVKATEDDDEEEEEGEPTNGEDDDEDEDDDDEDDDEAVKEDVEE